MDRKLLPDRRNSKGTIMKRITPAACAAILALTSLGSSEVFAQPQVPVGPNGRPPVVSPFLGLSGGFGNPALNYFSFVQPQMQMQQQMGQLQFQQQQLMTGRAGNQQQDPSTLLPSTSSVPVFDNTFGYFNRISGASGGVSVGGGGFSPMGGAFANPPASAAAAMGATSFNRGMNTGMGNQPSFAAPRTPAPAPR